ncbi:purple acid phosphatase family protein [Actinacidiphila glaucinigra]|uniref:purple acid phosphatase family protein n=1 Tax=Actinacidiphila glaucinigra TaxID=235986 RepID=UPI00379AB184
MSEEPKHTRISRRNALGLFGATVSGAAAGPLVLGAGTAEAVPATSEVTGLTTGSATTPVQGLHLTFGADPRSQMVVSWVTDAAVRNPRVVYGTLSGGFGSTAHATTKTYVDGTSGRTVWVHHALLSKLKADTDYLYAAQHDGATPDAGTFHTAPSGRAPFTFTSFGDQGAPSVTWKTGANPADASGRDFEPNATPAAADIVTGVEKVGPLFHLLNGDLCYANTGPDRIRVWRDFLTNNSRSARFRPWMPCAGNHEIELGNGKLGLDAYQTYFELPSTETQPELDNLWYSFTVGSVKVIALQNDDIALQEGGDVYINGYSGGRQLAWLKKELKSARASKDIDWIVVCMHQVMISSATAANGADVALRAAYGPLFDEYGVDLVVCGHEHDYERSLAVRGVVPGSVTLTPNPSQTALDVIDSAHGTTHMVLGGGGVSGITNNSFTTDDADGHGHHSAYVQMEHVGKYNSVKEKETAVWIGVRDAEHPYGFAEFSVDPGRHPGDMTRIHVTYYNIITPTGELSVFEKFTLQRPRSDGGHGRH